MWTQLKTNQAMLEFSNYPLLFVHSSECLFWSQFLELGCTLINYSLVYSFPDVSRTSLWKEVDKTRRNRIFGHPWEYKRLRVKQHCCLFSFLSELFSRLLEHFWLHCCLGRVAWRCGDCGRQIFRNGMLRVIRGDWSCRWDLPSATLRFADCRFDDWSL